MTFNSTKLFAGLPPVQLMIYFLQLCRLLYSIWTPVSVVNRIRLLVYNSKKLNELYCSTILPDATYGNGYYTTKGDEPIVFSFQFSARVVCTAKL